MYVWICFPTPKRRQRCGRSMEPNWILVPSPAAAPPDRQPKLTCSVKVCVKIVNVCDRWRRHIQCHHGFGSSFLVHRNPRRYKLSLKYRTILYQNDKSVEKIKEPEEKVKSYSVQSYKNSWRTHNCR